MEGFASFTVNYFALCTVLAGHSVKRNTCVDLVCSPSRGFLIEIESQYHFSTLPLVAFLLRANLPRKPRRSAPLAPVREPCPAILAIVAGLRASKLTDCIESAVIAKQPRTNSTIRHNPYCANHASRPTFRA